MNLLNITSYNANYFGISRPIGSLSYHKSGPQPWFRESLF